ncbi:hypothetical protein SO802_010512 [Lithocarpus litseifolius]|uniref:Pectinesterase inhibitor domain-containing protein n=1 Tax=Lithocarpus litseifolius TaxID=425828 RepID=A0AAW2DIM4_9ROSI
MASPISCLSILVIPLLVTSLSYHVSNADRALLEYVCQKTSDYDYCLSALLSNNQSTTATPYTLGIISNDLTLAVIQDTNREIADLFLNFTDPVDVTRILNCQKNIKDAYQKVQNARLDASQKSYSEEYKLIAAALEQTIDCKNQYADPPEKEPPILNWTHKLETQADASFAIIDLLL